MTEPLLVDTHTLVWYFEGSPRLDSRASARLDASLAAGSLCAASVSVREILRFADRRALRRLVEVGPWIRRAAREGLIWLSCDPDVALESGRLPGEPPRDPFDQIIIATARVHDLTLATRDGAILDYARGGHLRVMAV